MSPKNKKYSRNHRKKDSGAKFEVFHFQKHIHVLFRTDGPYEDTRTGPNQVLRPNNGLRTGLKGFRHETSVRLFEGCKNLV